MISKGENAEIVNFELINAKSRNLKLKQEIAKRDELITRAITMLKTIDRFNDVREWLEEVEELKEVK